MYPARASRSPGVPSRKWLHASRTAWYFAYGRETLVEMPALRVSGATYALYLPDPYPSQVPSERTHPPVLVQFRSCRAYCSTPSHGAVAVPPADGAGDGDGLGVDVGAVVAFGVGAVVVLNSRPNPSGGDHGPVAFGPLPGGNGDLRALNPGLLASYWQLLLRAADLVILDAPPVLASPVCLGLAPTVDGVILLVEAERTRQAVAEAARDALQACGANLLGVVLNKRRFAVPAALYRRL